MKKILYALVAVSVSGCLLTQSDPAPVEKKPFLQGRVVVENMVASNQGEISVLEARFAIRPEAKEPAKPVGARLSTSTGRFEETNHLLQTDPVRGPECQKVKISKKSNQSKPEAETEPETPASFVDVGKIGFGPVLQTNLMILEPLKSNQYVAALQAGLPAGAYQLINDGTPKTPAFVEVLSMPEQVAHLRLGGKDFGDPTMTFRPGRTLELFWREPAIANDRNGLMVEMAVEDADFIYDVFCAKYESDIPATAGHKIWNIDAAWFSEFPQAGTANFYFIRTHLLNSVASQSEILLQGRRTFFARMPTQP